MATQVNTPYVMLGAAFGWWAPGGTPYPTVTNATTLSNYPVSWNGDGSQTLAWTAPWTPFGATIDGVTFTWATSTGSINIEEQATPVATPITTQVGTLGFTLSEDSFNTYLLAYGVGSTSTTASTSTVYGSRRYTFGTTLSDIAVVMDMQAPPITAAGVTPQVTPTTQRLYIPHMTSGASVAVQWRRNTAQRQWATTLTANCPPSQMFVDQILPFSS